MSSAIERYLKEDDPLRKTIATGGKEYNGGTSAKGLGKGNNPAFGQAPADPKNTIKNMEKHMKEHQGKNR